MLVLKLLWEMRSFVKRKELLRLSPRVSQGQTLPSPVISSEVVVPFYKYLRDLGGHKVWV